MEQNDSSVIYSEKELVLQLDMTFDEEINNLSHVRNIIGIIQQYRKELKLKPWNQIRIKHFSIDKNFPQNYKEIFENKLGCPFENYDGEETKNTKEYIYSDLNNNKKKIDIYCYVDI